MNQVEKKQNFDFQFDLAILEYLLNFITALSHLELLKLVYFEAHSQCFMNHFQFLHFIFLNFR